MPLCAGVISRGAQGVGPLVELSAHIGGSAPLKLLHWLGFSEFIDLASKVICSIVHCYMVIEAFLIVDYIISVLNKIIMFPSLKTWAWL